MEEQYNEYRKIGLSSRKSKSLKSRYHRLSRSVQAFVGCYKEANNYHKSGYSEKNIMDEACALYTKYINGDFKCEHAWQLWRDESKWKGELMFNHSRRHKHSIDGVYTSSSSPSTLIDCLKYEHAQPSTHLTRQKATKRKAKAKTSNASSNYMDLSNWEAGVTKK